MIWLYVAQLALPLILIGWLLWRPARSSVGFLLQALGSFSALAVMALQGIWLLPPWWVIYLFAGTLGGTAWLAWRRIQPFSSPAPTTWSAWTVLIFFSVLGVTSTYGVAIAWQSRTAPDAGLVNLAFPLQPGRYLVVNGGMNISTNAHLETLDARFPRYRAWRGQSYGVDLVGLDRWGLRARGLQPADPHAYAIYGARVLAPCTGRVVSTVKALPDMQVPATDREHLAGNHVLLRCLDADVLLGHLQSGSVRVRAGAEVVVGDWLGLVGNSGNTGEPHLHLHAQGIGPVNAPLGGDPRPVKFNGRFAVRGDRIEMP